VHERVGASLERTDDVLQAGQPGQQQDGDHGEGGVGLDGAAQRMAVHAGHGDVADDEVGRRGADRRQRRQAVRRHANAKARLALEHAHQMLGLGQAVLDHQDVVAVNIVRLSRHDNDGSSVALALVG
jgi:hypothetical protein